ncbi:MULTISPECIES: hypothetical protein [Deefgea]|uniref:VCBS repeat-containing protein n=1 Tax=Deefgea chitinilytica TaxID=570276 RepID=A0ABS2CET5_9NEIS|nr:MULTISPECIES: hypothetical protein [Deefgea]MBM5572651.1 hypothetical protein [Deefgea chitinilytica]MBM9889887.1 hypothetical protein [Deefgea sp. CFH1-16]
MRIIESDVSLTAQRSFQRERSERVSIRYEAPRPVPNNVDESVSISSAARMIEEQEEAVNNDPRLRMIKSLLEAMLGHEIKLGHQAPDTNKAELQSNTQTTTQIEDGFSIEYHASEQESEQTQFNAEGVIKTADGREISFSSELKLSRSFSQTVDINIATGSAARPKKDPLVLNYDAPVATLSDKTFQFDIDADGKNESLHMLTRGSAYLALDRNRDGKINDGKELFGAQSGNGFADLTQYDGDQNGWIDEADTVYADLKLWLKDASGQDQLLSISQLRIGAISVRYARGDFDLNNQQNQNYGQIRSSGVYLKENGQVGTLQQVDLSV